MTDTRDIRAMNLKPPIDFPLPKFDNVTVAFGADAKAYLTREQLGDWYGLYGDNSETPFHKAVKNLFHRGGVLADHGLTPKEGYTLAQIMPALRALMGSWAPKHEIKIGTCAVALANWCDYSPPRDGA
jgi:hypothetical protein